MRITLEQLGALPIRNRFIVLEGVNGAGKSTLLEGMRSVLSEHGHDVVVTREPGGTPLGVEVRRLLLESQRGAVGMVAELLLFAADRAQHVETHMQPALARGACVISDRYFYSTEAFQGYGRGIDRQIIDVINQTAICGLLPDLVIVLDLDPAEGLRRAAIRSSDGAHKRDRLEDEDLAFHSRIRHGFLEIAERRPEPFLVLDAQRSAEDLRSLMAEVLLRRYGDLRSCK